MGLGDGYVAYGSVVTHSYSDDGIYNVTLTITDDDGCIGNISKIVILKYKKYELSVIINPPNSGYVHINPLKKNYEYGTKVTLIAYAYSNYRFAGWSGDAVGYENVIQVVMNENKTIIANFVTSSVVQNTPPEIHILYPENGSYVNNSIMIRGIANDEDGDVLKIEIRIDNGSWILVENLSWYYEIDTTELKNGMHIIEARAYDGKDYATDSLCIYVNNNHKPYISIYECKNGVIRGIVKDEDGDVLKIEIRIDNGSWIDIGEWEQGNWSYEIKLKGKHIVEARAYDGKEFSNIAKFEIKSSKDNTILIIIIIALVAIIFANIVKLFKKRGFNSMNRKGQVGVIVAILIVTLFAIMLITIQTYYIPRWMKEREAEHMDLVANQFASLKYSVDLQAIERSESPLINSITLGSKELPYFVTSRAFGSLQILSSNSSNFSISINGDGMKAVLYSFENNIGEITNILKVNELELYIENLQKGDTYNLSVLSANISVEVGTVNNFVQINLTVINNTQIIFSQPIAVALKDGISYRINLLNEDYKFKDILQNFPTPYNISINGSSNGTFIINCLRFQNVQISQTNKLGTIKYSSQNAYFVDQDYIYEGGAVILSQAGGNTMLFPPMLIANNQTFNLTLINIVGVAGKTGAAGYGTFSIRTNFSSWTSYIYYATNVTINITTLYPSAWKDFLKEELNGRVTEGENFVLLNLQNIIVRINIARIYAQVGPGWVVT